MTHCLLNRCHPNASCVQSSSKCPAPEKGEIIHYSAVNRWDENDEFDEWAKPSSPLSVEAERILGVTNSQLAHCRSTDVVLQDFDNFTADNEKNYRQVGIKVKP
jgi:hypothetical protein